jgi:N-acylneuraminate cytidylyltransferase
MVDSQLEVLAIVPARGGSKSIPLKNTKLLGGHPLIAYSIAAGKQARMVQRLIVSTDDRRIAEIAETYGAEVPFLRPSELAGEEVPDLPVFEHALEWLATNEGYAPDLVVQLRPTSPFRPPLCLDDSISLLRDSKQADCVRTVTPSTQNPYKMWRIEDELMVPLLATEWEEPYNMPRQLLPSTYWQTGQVDTIRYQTIMQKHSMTGERIRPLVIDPIGCEPSGSSRTVASSSSGRDVVRVA